MKDQTASQTALGTAYCRAAHQILDPAPLLFPDPIAVPLLGPDAADRIRENIDRHQSPYGRGLRSHVCLRSRVAEDRLRASGATWYILVGAGFDTFAWRQPDWARSMRIVEVDHPATQAAKREMLASAGLETPGNLTFAAVDFSQESLGEVLARLGIGPEDSVYFSWLGVTMYLDEAAIDASLAAMVGAAKQVSLTLTFKTPDDSPSDAAIAAFVASLGEAFVSHFTPDEMSLKLAQHGFAQQDFLTPEKALEAYFTPLRGGIPAPRRTSIVHAVKAS